VVAFCASGPARADIASLVVELRARRAGVSIVGCGESADMSLPDAAPEPLAPIVAIVRGQQLAYELATALGFDPDSPAGLSKVTTT
jgi:glucosamine--fructose-6-phosphate aminotransferase (isomerizing)